MENFKQIAEDCLAGKLSGTFVLRNGKVFHSQTHLSTTGLYALPYCIAGWCYSVVGNCYSSSVSVTDNDVIDFIPDNMQEQIKIDIPEGMEVIQEETPDGIKIRFIKKSLSYEDIENKWPLHTKIQIQYFWNSNVNEYSFSKRIEVLRKLINIRNYFGGDKPTNSWIITIDSALRPFVIKNPRSYRESCFIYFDTKEHAEQAVKMLGDELKYLFEPW